MTEAAAPKYWAFISYSHADEAWAQWLHRALETYRVPRRLVGRPLGGETIPRRLFPVFRDRDELPSSHELGAVINRALAGSRNLVVICSPRAATSRWVNEEIKAFRALGRSDRVFCLIVDGEPHASQKPEIAFSECFPPALRSEGFEPIAADARARKDGKDGARLKLLAGILGLGLDDLRQREKQRQRRRLLLNIAAGVALATVLGGTVQWFLAQRAAREREIRIEQLTDLGRRELLDGRQARAAVYLNEARLRGDDSLPVRFMLGQAMHAVDAFTAVRVQTGAGSVRRALFSPDGARLVLLAEQGDELIGRVFDAATGAPLEMHRGLPRHPRIARYIASDLLLVAGYADQSRETESGPSMAVWRKGDEVPLLSVVGTSGRAGSPASPDGRLLAAATESGVAIVRTDDGERIRTLAPGRAFSAVTYSPDGRWLATGGRDGRVELWPASAPRASIALRGLEGQPVVGLEFAPDGTRVIALSGAGDVRVWEVATGALAIAFGADPRWVTQIALSANGRRLLTVGSEGYKVWSMARGILLFGLQKSLYRDATAALSADGNYLYAADTTASIGEAWAVRSRTRLHTMDLHSGSATAIALDPAGRRIALGSDDGTASLWRTDVNPKWSADTGGTMAPFRVGFGHGDDELLIAGGNHGAGVALLMDWQNETLLRQFGEHRHFIRDAAVSPGQDRLLTAGADGVGAVWSLSNGNRLGAITDLAEPLHQTGLNADGTRGIFLAEQVVHREEPRGVLVDAKTGRSIAVLRSTAMMAGHDFSPDGTRLATIDLHGTIRIWNAADGAALAEKSAHRSEARSIEFDPSGRRLLTGGADHAVRIWSAESLAELVRFDDPALGVVFQAAWSPDARLVGIATESGAVWIWDPASGEKRALKGHASAVTSLTFLGSGELLLSRGFDGTVRAWDVATGQELALVASLGDELTAPALNPAQTLLAIGSVNRQVGIWSIQPEIREPAALARHLACRSPWTLDGESLRPAAIDLSACAK